MSAAHPPPGNNWPLPPAEVEALFEDESLELRALEPTEQGTMENYRAKVYSPRYRRELDVNGSRHHPAMRKDSTTYRARRSRHTSSRSGYWTMSTWSSQPQRSIASHWRSIGVSFRKLRRRSSGRSASPASCPSGCRNTRHPEPIYEPQRFAEDPAYAYHVANANLVAYLIDHRDSRPNNFLEANDLNNRRLFLIDNGIAFGTHLYDVTQTNWNHVYVPALRNGAIERLRHVTIGDVDGLAVLVNLRANSDGVLVPAVGDPLIDPDEGSRVNPGWLQLGLTADEIADLDGRIRLLLQLVDQGDIAVF